MEILGTTYSVKYLSRKQDSLLLDRAGYCDETYVDWFASQFPKILAVYKELEIL